MKMVYCTCNISVLPRVQRICEELEVGSYQILDRVRVKNRVGAHRFNDAVWPGYNALILIQFHDNTRCENLLTAFRQYNEQTAGQNERLTVCSWDLEQYFE